MPRLLSITRTLVLWGVHGDIMGGGGGGGWPLIPGKLITQESLEFRQVS